MDDVPLVMTFDEVCAFLRLKKRVVLGLVEDGVLPTLGGVKSVRSMRFLRAVVLGALGG